MWQEENLPGFLGLCQECGKSCQTSENMKHHMAIGVRSEERDSGPLPLYRLMKKNTMMSQHFNICQLWQCICCFQIWKSMFTTQFSLPFFNQNPKMFMIGKLLHFFVHLFHEEASNLSCKKSNHTMKSFPLFFFVIIRTVRFGEIHSSTINKFRNIRMPLNIRYRAMFVSEKGTYLYYQ